MRQPALQGRHQFGDRHRLGQVGVHAGGQAAFGLALQGGGGQGDHRGVFEAAGGFFLAQGAGELVAVHYRHMHVRQHQGVTAGAPGLKALAAVFGAFAGVAGQGQLAGHDQAVGGVVVDDQHQAALGPGLFDAGQGPGQETLGRVGRGLGFELSLHAPRQHQVQADGGAGPRRAVHADLAAHQFRQAPGDDQAQAGAAVATGGAALGLGEGLEQPGLLFRGDADAGIGDPEAQAVAVAVPAFPLQRGFDHALVGELDGVGQEVRQHLAKAKAVGTVGRADAVVHFAKQHQALARRRAAEVGDGGLQQARQRNRGRRQLQPAGLDLREVQDVADDLQQRPRRLLDDRDGAALVFVEPAVRKHLEHAGDADHRRADFMAHGRDEVRLGFAGLQRAGFAGAQALFELPDLREVGAHREVANGIARRVTHRRRGQQHRDGFAILAHEVQLKWIGALVYE